ncbi:hypothetical protein ACQY0O_003572 [Thecaphora frezii]
MVTHSYSRSPACFDDPVFARTHFLARVVSEDLGVTQIKHRHRLCSNNHSDLEAWDARWFPSAHSDDEGTSGYDDDDTSEDEDHHNVVAAETAMSRDGKAARARSATAPASTEASTSARQIPFTKPRLAPLSEAIKKRRDRRHDRSASAPEPRLMPAQPLSINTAQPLRLAQPNISTLSPLAYPVGIFDSDASALQDREAATDKRKANVPSPSYASDGAPSLVAMARLSSASATRPIAIECSESDGSCHNDAGDQDPEGQLAAEIIRLREARKADSQRTEARSKSKGASSHSECRQGAAGGAHPLQHKADRELKTSTFDYVPESDFDEGDIVHSDTIKSHASHPILRFAEAMLDFGTCSLERLTGDGSAEASVDSLASDTGATRQRPVKRMSTTPKDLGREAQLMRLRRQETTSARSSRSNSVNSLSTLYQSSEPSLGLRARTGRHATSLLSLPSMLSSQITADSSRPAAATTLSTSVTASLMPASPSLGVESRSLHDAEEEIDVGYHTTRSTVSSVHYPRYTYGIDSYSDAPLEHLAPLSAGLDVVFQRFDRYSKDVDPSMSIEAFKHPDTISPLWREDVDGCRPEPSLWSGLFGAQ